MSAVLSNDVNSLILPEYSLSQFAPPTNKASSTTYSTSYASNGSSTCVETNTTNGNTSLPTFPAPYSNVPFLPVSKGNIKKLAQTRFVNSSPKSYRLMPASVESSESDRTSFVEKTSHKFFLPVTYFLEIAKLWEVSNRSELECHFTIANNKEEFKTTGSVLHDEHTSQHKQRPICHARPIPAKLWGSHKTTLKRQRNENSVEAEKDLLRSVNRFLGSCRTKDKISASMSDISTSSTNVGSETRRYLSQIVSLMSRKFAARLVNQQNDFDFNGKTMEFLHRTTCINLTS
uniref:Uncharacterized protein n=1 Tax=Ciona intestinalis TaxID=7719 RepID=F6SGY0_CIOIN